MPYRLRNASPHHRPVDERQKTGRNQALAATMKRLRAGRSIAALRQDMAEKGVSIGIGTLHRAIRGEMGNRLESLEKIASFFDTTVDQLLQFDGVDEAFWPFSDELQRKVLTLSDPELRTLENVMRAHLGLNVSDSSTVKKIGLATDEQQDSSYAELREDGVGPLDEAELPASKQHARETNRRPTRQKGSGGA